MLWKRNQVEFVKMNMPFLLLALLGLLAAWDFPTPASGQMAPPAPPNVATSKRCPSGYQLVGKYCEMHEYSQPRTVCPPGLNYMNGQCQQLAPQQRACPPRYQLQGDWCEMVDQTPAEFICRDGVLDESGKSCRIVANQQPACPNGYQDEGGRCVRYSFPVRDCRDGYTMQGEDCARSAVVTANPQCPPSSRFDSVEDACVSATPQGVECPASFGLHPQLNRCIRPRPKVLSVCPRGALSTMSSDGTEICEAQQTFPLSYQCPNGHRLDQNRGICTREAATAGVDCPTGFMPSPVNPTICERELPPLSTCPPGTVMDGWGPSARCKVISHVEPAAKCPSGHSLMGGDCVARTASKPLLVCESGNLVGDICVTDKYVALQYGCPNGFEAAVGSQGTVCSKLVKKPCTETTGHRLECGVEEEVTQVAHVEELAQIVKTQHVEEVPTGLTRVYPSPTHNQEHGRHNYRRAFHRVLKADVPRPKYRTHSPYSGYAPPPVEVGEVPMVGYTRVNPTVIEPSKGSRVSVAATPRKKCHKVAVTEEKLCTKEEIVKPEKICPEDSELVGKKCRIRTTIPPSLKCPAGTELDNEGSCSATVKTTAVYECPYGSQIGDNGKCFAVAEQPPSTTCPEGTAFSPASGRCLQRVTGTMLPNQLVATQAVPICARGVPQGNVCVEVSRSVRTLECPPGTVENRFQANLGECIEPAEALPPSRPSVVGTPQFLCPDGRPSAGRMCHITDIVRPAMTCPTGTRLEGTQCVRTTKMVPRPPRVNVQSAISSCPPGYSLRGNQCVMSHKQPATVNCPAGYERRAADCARIASPQQVCPPGTEQTSQGCRVRRQVAPQITVVRQCTKGEAGC